MKRITLMLLSLCMLTIANAQVKKTPGLAKRTLKQVMEVAMPGENGVDGSNGGSVAYNPIAKKYYIPMLGNAVYPMVIFDLKGKQLSKAIAGNDMRGLWYNPKTKSVEGNCYDSGGWVRYKLNPKGDMVFDMTEVDDTYESDYIFQNDMRQPENQSVGFYSSQDNMLYFLTEDGVSIYSMKGEEKKTITLRNRKEDEALFFLDAGSPHNNSLIYTGLPKAEIGLLNIDDKKIELYNKATGLLSAEWQLPDDVGVYPMFNFSYANGMVWLFNKELRKWVVFK